MIVTLQTLIFFRESFLRTLDRLLRPYYNRLSLAFGRKGEVSDDEESDEQVFAEYDDERGVVFYPPMYLQRYAAVSDCLMDGPWSGKLEKVVDLGYNDMSFIKYLKEVQGIRCILGVDLENIPLRCSLDLIGCEDHVPKRENPLEVTLFKGNAADPDYRLIGCDAVIAIEMIEHMLPHDLDRLIHTVFGFIKPWVVIFTTPNGDFNVLFKAMEKNGLRRLDHFFEWSRDQFHDWCSNIVVRYPQYTVSCKGIGPGPTGTKHIGCCSQMAVFVAKEYEKQQDLNINSLALVSDSPSPHSISNLISSWETSDIPIENNMIEAPKNNESYSDLGSPNQSIVSIFPSSPSGSIHTFPYQDKMSQCNLDSEKEMSFLMFDYEQMCFDVLEPRRNMELHRVYDIEDVYNRLNCTTLEVKKFSKTTKNLMARNKVDTLEHSREVVDEIRHLTKMLNFNRELNNQLENSTNTWCNINWGENAPYWNQYYSIVKTYSYPFEVKSEECRILDLISDEINRLIDAQFDEDFSFEVNRMEIPIDHLMRVLDHVTDDVDKVKDLLEWNGYEVLDNIVIHSRMVVDYSSAGTQEHESQETLDVYSDWDSTSLSEGSTVPDYHARCLRRALDQKVRRLRSMLTADEDITTELDRVVCKLMKLALRTSKGRNTPPPTRWMQCKLLDLLTLTEKSIERRKRHFIESYPLQTINYEEKSQEMIALERIKEDDTASKVVDKYKHLVNDSDDMDANYRYLDYDLEDDLSASGPDFAKGYEYLITDQMNSDLESHTTTPIETTMFLTEELLQGELKFKRTQAWVDDDVEVVPYPIHDGSFDNYSLSTNRNMTSKVTKFYKMGYKGKQCIELDYLINKKRKYRAYKHTTEQKSKESSRTKLGKRLIRKESSNISMRFRTTHKKYVSVDYKTYRIKPKRKQYKNLYSTLSKTIPLSLIEMCHQEKVINVVDQYNLKRDEKNKFNQESASPLSLIEMCHQEKVINVVDQYNLKRDEKNKFNQESASYDQESEVAYTERSMLIDIVTEDTRETIALRRNIGTDAEVCATVFGDETLIQSVSNAVINEIDFFEKHDVSTDNINSQTIFLNDINEPSTSKGIRHTAMYAQCCHDTIAPGYSMLSATTSLTRVPKIFTTGIRIGETETDTKISSSDFGTYTYDNNYNQRTILPRQRSVGIKIKDSDSNLLISGMEISNVPTYSALIAKDSMLYVLRQSDSLRNTVLFSPRNSKETILGLSLPDGLHKGSNINISMNLDCSTSTREMYDKLIVSSQDLFEKQIIDIHNTPAEFNDFTSNLPLQSECSDRCHEIYKLNLFSKETFVKPSSKDIQIKSVDFQTHGQVSRSPKRMTHAFDIKKPRVKSKFSPQKPVKKSKLAKSLTKNYDIVSDLAIDLPTGAHCISQTEFNENLKTPTSSPCSFSNKITATDTKQKLETDESGNLPNTKHFTLENHEVSRSNSSQQFPESISYLKSSVETKDIFSTTEFICVNFKSGYERNENRSSTSSTLHNSEPQVDSADKKNVRDSGLPVTKHVTRELCSGGVQVHSYKDQQDLSEDVMYQGQWQKNMPKKVTKRKCFASISKKIDVNSKKKNDSKQISKTKISKEKICNKATKAIRSKEKICVNDRIKEDFKKEPLICRDSANRCLKQDKDINKIKQNLKLPKTVCVATVAKPFRNILKVPSKFPVSHLPSKNLKPPFIIVKSPSPLPSPLIKSEKTPWKRPRKNYIPPYLRRRTLNSVNTNKAPLNLTLDFSESNIENSNKSAPKILVRSKTDEIQRDLLKFRASLPVSRYMVYRNDVEKKNSDKLQLKNAAETPSKKDASRQRSSTPNSANSSTGSSPCSIATVRAIPTRTKNSTRRRHSGSPYVNSTETDSENSTPERNRKFTKRKNSRITVENKENIPQSSRYSSDGKRDTSKHSKTIFMGHKKEVYIAQVKKSLHSTVNDTSRHKNQKFNVNIPKTISFSDTKLLPRPSLSQSNMPSAEISECMQTSNMVLVVDPRARQLHIAADMLNEEANVACPYLATKIIHSTEENTKVDSNIQNIHFTIKELIEEALNFLDDSFDSVTVVLDENPTRDYLMSSPTSFKSTITSDDNCMNEVLEGDIEFALNTSLEVTLENEDMLSLNDTHVTVTDFDVTSFKSIASGSQISGYWSADNEFSSSIKLPKCTYPAPNSTSVRDIFERKDQPFQPLQRNNMTGTLANQAFSGFTINEDAVAGDQPDIVNLIDSETGSLAILIARQAISEELLISGRSSDSFASCELDDDVVPSWLFHIINQQRSELEDLNSPEEIQVPIVEPLFDDNANMLEAPGVGAGAGDGRGIHSDHSHDSSGQGTSISSSETSSGLQSEAILIDPAAFGAQFELLREAVEGSAVLVTNNIEPLDNETINRQVAALIESDQQSFSRGESRRTLRAFLNSASDADADVSSLDTDYEDQHTTDP